MADKESNGLLSKVVKFVRNPGSGWSEGEQDASESSYSKQMLKEMIERKRRNDFVRKREFDMLRKMRRSEVMAGQDPAARPSFFQSSMPSKPDDRASTLKKIDEIEAQMSMQWWKCMSTTCFNRPRCTVRWRLWRRSKLRLVLAAHRRCCLPGWRTTARSKKR
jgi:hypothetical protein